MFFSSSEAEEKLFEKMQHSKFTRKQRNEAVVFIWNWCSLADSPFLAALCFGTSYLQCTSLSSQVFLSQAARVDNGHAQGPGPLGAVPNGDPSFRSSLFIFISLSLLHLIIIATTIIIILVIHASRSADQACLLAAC